MATLHVITLTDKQRTALRQFLDDELDGHDATEMRDTFGAYHAICNSEQVEVDSRSSPTLGEALAILMPLEDDENADLGYVYRAYSGRGMFGQCCIGFVTHRPDDLIAKAGMQGARRDSLGMDTIVYWPSIADKG